MNKLSIFLLAIIVNFGYSQKRSLDHSDYELWHTIKNTVISTNGKYVAYELEKGEANSSIVVKSLAGDNVFEHERASNPKIDFNAKQLFFTIKAWKDTVNELKRKKVDKKLLPKDSLGIYTFLSKDLVKIPAVQSYQIPEKWSGYVAIQIEDKVETTKDTSSTKKDKAGKQKKANKKNGYHVLLYNLDSKKIDTLKFVTDYKFAKHEKQFVYATTGSENDSTAGVYKIDLKLNKSLKLHDSKTASYKQLAISNQANYVGFVLDADTTKTQQRPNELYLWKNKDRAAKQIASNTSTPKGYLVSSDGKLHFSEDESKLYYGLRTPLVIKDTTLIDDEIVNVEVWTYNEPRLYTVQELDVKKDTIKSYLTALNLKTEKSIQIETIDYPDSKLANKGDAQYALIQNETPYMLESQWTGMRLKDFDVVDVSSGTRTEAFKATPNADLSPLGNYAYGYHAVDSTWFTYNIRNKQLKQLTKGSVFYNELYDSPNHPNPYGHAGWLAGDAQLLLYDRYDIWAFNPDTGESERLTKGREQKLVYRYIDLDKENEFIAIDSEILLSVFNEDTKASGYASLNLKTKQLSTLVYDDYNYDGLMKAEDADAYVYTRESFKDFPDLWATADNFKSSTKISAANPQQDLYLWGTNELVNWNALDGKPLMGMLIKPENFDPNKKYPLLVYFYERMSDRLHNHVIPAPGRSSINFSFYASRGYVIFVPDIIYAIGYPGQSAYNSVIPGIDNLIAKGFIDKDRIGVQGHSWGGYQVAHLVTKTNIFKAAESGAPVVNMFSAYGGIRWWTGLSRQFQYEHTQSRIGGTPWDSQDLYIENSPVFNVDKINTPLLIMHNDADGHVPWYQGIEFFTNLRRLGKPSWFLNYNDEPHWPLKYQNRVDFNIRMAQFFDYYLKDAPMPKWMKEGVPAVEKGINQGYELLER